MRFGSAVVFMLMFAWLACAGQASFHEGRTTLVALERQHLGGAAVRHGEGFERVWRRPGATTPGLLKWDGHSSVVGTAPADLLESIRDQMGALNQVPREGRTVFVTVTVYAYRRSWLGRPEARYELVGRDLEGQLLWAADDAVEARPELALSIVDAESVLIARAVVGKLRRAMGL